MMGYEDGGLRLECTSAGWFPEPHAVWRDPYGEVVPALEEACTVDADGLFRVATAVVVRDCSVRNMSCSVNNTLLGQEKEAVIFIPGSSPARGRLPRGRLERRRGRRPGHGRQGAGEGSQTTRVGAHSPQGNLTASPPRWFLSCSEL